MPDNKKVDEASSAQEGTQNVSSKQPEVDLSKYVPIEDLRRLQAKKDREVAEALRRAEEAERRAAQEREEFLKLIGEQPEIKANFELAQLRAKASQFDKLREQEEQLARAKQQYAQAFGVSEEDLAEARTPAEAFALARKLERERMLEELKREFGITGKREAENEEGEEPPEVPASRGAPPDASTLSLSEWEREREEAKEAVRNEKSRRRRERLRLEVLKRSMTRQPLRRSQV